MFESEKRWGVKDEGEFFRDEEKKVGFSILIC
jgi:hypothetical protein